MNQNITKPPVFTLTLKEKEYLVDNVWAFRFTPSQPQVWIAGQYISVDLPHPQPDGKGTARWFTISSAPFEGIIQITTRITDSTFKHALATLPVGGSLNALDLPHGSFTWQDTNKPLVFVAGGIGITPFRSILRQRAHDNLPLTAQLVYANRTNDVIFKDELASYAANDSNLNISYVIGEPLTPARLVELVPKLNESLVYLSGPGPMVKTLGAELEAAGLPSGQLKVDSFPSYSDKTY